MNQLHNMTFLCSVDSMRNAAAFCHLLRLLESPTSRRWLLLESTGSAVARKYALVLLRHVQRLEYRETDASLPTVQEDFLMTLLKTNQETSFGNDHDFQLIHSREKYVQRVPLSTHAYFQRYIERVAKEEKGVLTATIRSRWW